MIYLTLTLTTTQMVGSLLSDKLITPRKCDISLNGGKKEKKLVKIVLVD